MSDSTDDRQAGHSERDGRRPRRARRWWPLALLLLVLAAGYLMGWHHHLSLAGLAESRATLKGMADAHPLAAPIVYALIYALVVAASIPVATALTIFAGFLFGWALATGLVAIAATTGATILFVAARGAFGDSLRRRLGGRAAKLASGFEKNDFAYLLALRLAPIIPFFLVNIAPAFFNVRLASYIGATFLGILPAVLAYAWLGEGIESVLAVAEASGRDVGVADLATFEIIVALALLALVATIGAVVRTLHTRRR